MTLAEALLNSIISPTLQSIDKGKREAPIETIFESTVNDDIAILRELKNRSISSFNIHDRLFAKKTLNFLSRLKGLASPAIEQFLNRGIDAMGRQYVGERLLSVIDRASDMQKARFMGALLKQMIVAGNYALDEYFTYCDLLDSLSMSSLRELPLYAQLAKSQEHTRLLSARLFITQRPKDESQKYSSYILTEEGSFLCNVIQEFHLQESF